MQQLNERRKDKRLPIELHLEINHMFRQNNEIIDAIDAEIKVVDISRSGIGFISKAVLPLEYYFNARIQLHNNDFFCGVLKIIRQSQINEQEFIYGAEFVGLAPFLADKITVYEQSILQKDSDC